VARNPGLHIGSEFWQTLLVELCSRTEDHHESGAFLLGCAGEKGRRVERIVYYDELDANAYETGVVVMHAPSFGKLWELCRSSKLSVVADIHVHPAKAFQSLADRNNPMIAQRGHLALIVPDYARPPVLLKTLGFFEYQGAHRWRNLGGERITRFLHIAN
jgi:proteasome lid subunit RPN8/RPN11